MYGGRRHKSWLASCMPSLGCPGDSRYALASIGASQVANWFVGVIKLGGPSGDLQSVTLVALIALARSFRVYLRTVHVYCPEATRANHLALIRTCSKVSFIPSKCSYIRTLNMSPFFATLAPVKAKVPAIIAEPPNTCAYKKPP